MTNEPRPIPVTEIVRALEREAANTDTDPRWRAAKELRLMTGWRTRTLMCCLDPRPSNEITNQERAMRPCPECGVPVHPENVGFHVCENAL